MFQVKTKKMWTLLLVGAALIPVALSAAVSARIDVHPDGKKEIELKIEKKNINGWLSHIGWGRAEERKYSLSFTVSSVTPEWKRTGFTFIPQKSGKISLFLLSNKRDGEDRWILFDDVKITGAKIINPGFELVDTKGMKADQWSSRGKGYELVKDKAVSCEGSNCIKVFHDQPAIQTIEVSAGQPVTVSCMVKLPPIVKKK